MEVIILIGVLVAFGAFLFYKAGKSHGSDSGGGALPGKYDQDKK